MQKTSKTDITEEIKGESTYKNRSLRNGVYASYYLLIQDRS